MVISQRIKAKLCGADTGGDFRWLDEISSKRRRNLPVKVYRGFKLNSRSYFEGDCVLINIDIQFGIMDENYEIARILECYSNGDKSCKGYVKVQWFTSFDKIRKGHRKYLNSADYPPVDADREVVKDMFTYENDVDVETISGHCYIQEVPASFTPSIVKRSPKAVGPFYVCRFAYKKTAPYIFPFTDNDVYCGSPEKSPVALVEITNSPKNKILSSHLSNKSKTPIREQSNSDRKTYVAEENLSLHERKRNVKRKLLDLDDDQENICTKKPKKENERKTEGGTTSESSYNKNKGNSSSFRISVLSPFKRNLHVSSPLKDATSLLSPRKENSSPFKKSVEHSSPKITKTLLEYPLLEEKCNLRESLKSPPSDKNIDSIKTIGQCRGLKQGEISDLLVDEEEEDEDAIDGESDDSDFEDPRRIKQKDADWTNNTRKGHRVKKKPSTYIKKSEEDHASTSTTIKRKVSKKGVEDCPVEDGEMARLRTSKDQTPKKETCDKALIKFSKLESLKIPEKDDSKHSIKTKAIDKSTTKNSKLSTPKSKKNDKREELSKPKTPKGKAKLVSVANLPDRNTPVKENNTEFEQAKAQLHVSAVPSYLPCREDEFQQIFSFVEGKLLDSTGGCMYVSGVPGTGKTATVREILRVLKECEKDGTVPQFQFLEVNSMKLTKPHQLWVQIWEGLTGQRATPDHAYSLFKKSLGLSSGPKRKSIFLLLDELDLLWTKKQDVMYNLFDLASQGDSRLVVITIANTMDLPERMMISRVQSRLGLTRMTFQPYTFKQLQEIIASRLQGIRAFDSDAIQLVARKVAAVSGDARRALDICRRATELAELKKMEIFSSPIKSPKQLNVLVGMSHVTMAISEMFSSPKVQAIKQCSQMAKYLLQAILTEFSRTGIEEAVLLRVSEHLESICRLDGLSPPSSSDTLKLVNVLSAQKVIFTEHSRLDLMLRIRLNISTDDVSYALSL